MKQPHMHAHHLSMERAEPASIFLHAKICNSLQQVEATSTARTDAILSPRASLLLWPVGSARGTDLQTIADTQHHPTSSGHWQASSGAHLFGAAPHRLITFFITTLHQHCSNWSSSLFLSSLPSLSVHRLVTTLQVSTTCRTSGPVILWHQLTSTSMISPSLR